MLSDHFVNEALVAVCSIKDSEKFCSEIMESIHHIFYTYCNKITTKETSKESLIKAELVEYISNKRKIEKDFSLDDVLDSLTAGRFDGLIGIVKTLEKEYTPEALESFRNKVLKRRKLCDLLFEKDKIQRLLSDIEVENFKDEDEIINKWDSIISSSHDRLKSISRLESINEVSSLNLRYDSFDSVMEDLESSVGEGDVVPTGFAYLDKKLPLGGLEKRRLYLIGGASGIGKSLMLNQLMVNAATKSDVRDERSTGNPGTFLYITAENLITESLMRFYCSLFGQPNTEITHKLKKNKFFKKYENGEMDANNFKTFAGIEPEEYIKFELKDEIINRLENHGCNVEFKYVQARRTTVRDVENIISEVASRCNLRCIYIDYLDLIISRYDFVDERIMLGEVTQSFKNMAVAFNVPIVTATQLNREGYDPRAAASLVQTSESMKKVDQSDVIMFLQHHQEPKASIPTENFGTQSGKRIRITLLKNRNGPTGDTASLFIREKTGNIDSFCFTIEDYPSGEDEYTTTDENVITDEIFGTKNIVAIENGKFMFE